MNNLLDNGETYFAGRTKDEEYQKVTRHANFIAIGNGNTFLRGPNSMFPGRQRQDAAAIERFVMIDWKYDPELELNLCLKIAPGPKTERVVRWAHDLRKIVEPIEGIKGHELVVSMRGMLKLVKLLSLGFSASQSAEMAIFKQYAQRETLLKLCPLTF
jgi:hypothetical protein